MSGCKVIMRRIPHRLGGEPVEEHAFLAECGRPVESDGMCPYHVQQRDRDQRAERRRWLNVETLRRQSG